MDTFTINLVTKVIHPFHSAMVNIGLDSAFKVGIAGGVITAAALWATKPKFAFDEQTGQPRPWSFLSDASEEGEKPTYVTWYVFAGGVFYTLNLIA